MLLVGKFLHLALENKTVRLSNVDRVDFYACRLLIGRHVRLEAQQLGRNSKREWQGGGAKLRSALVFCVRKPCLGCKQAGRKAGRHSSGRRGHCDSDNGRLCGGVADRRDICRDNDWREGPDDGRIKDGAQRLVGQHDAAIVGARLPRGLVGDRITLAQKVDGLARQLQNLATVGRGR